MRRPWDWGLGAWDLGLGKDRNHIRFARVPPGRRSVRDRRDGDCHRARWRDPRDDGELVHVALAGATAGAVLSRQADEGGTLHSHSPRVLGEHPHRGTATAVDLLRPRVEGRGTAALLVYGVASQRCAPRLS